MLTYCLKRKLGSSDSQRNKKLLLLVIAFFFLRRSLEIMFGCLDFLELLAFFDFWFLRLEMFGSTDVQILKLIFKMNELTQKWLKRSKEDIIMLVQFIKILNYI